jgi:hypothetical protein
VLKSISTFLFALSLAFIVVALAATDVLAIGIPAECSKYRDDSQNPPIWLCGGPCPLEGEICFKKFDNVGNWIGCECK